ncbi:serine/threonine-protein kinase [Nonomuraea fuscirosea]|uniref:serine/threonine-protein kinase n=1 Tax=Nonomuraea fuscirosea TaxID=1291556 RepID=UPI0033D8D6E0
MRPLLAHDPVQVGEHRVVGRLGVGGQGVVYLGESPGGGRVAIKMLGAELDDAEARSRFRQEVGYARRVKAFCTAQVLASGELDGMPYVVSEYVDGPSLASVIMDRGPLRGAELRRLAIGTLTALAAIHQAGVVHRDFKPGNVLLSRDGPRVIDFGISRALEETEAGGELVGTPPYMAPEQFADRPVGRAADLFAWASTMVAAATGRPPFGTGDVAALITRILHQEPDLGELDGDLRELAARCLAKDPAARPTAAQALLTLLGHPVPERTPRHPGELLAEGQESAAPPSGAPRSAGGSRSDEGREAEAGEQVSAASGWRGRWPVVAGAVVTALVVVAAVLLLFPRSQPEPRPPAATAPASVPLPTPRPGDMARTSTTEVKIPGTGITLHENPADPLWVSSYRDERDGVGYTTYTRDPATGAFGFFGAWEEPIVAPGGRYVASLSVTRFRRSGFEFIRIRDRATGQDRELRTVDKPATLFEPVWSADGRRLLATVTDDKAKAQGFAVIDVVAGEVRTVEVADAAETRFAWGSGDSVLYQATGEVIRALDLQGRKLREFPGKLSPGGAVRTPIGTVFGTECPGNARDVCFLDEMSGAEKGEARLGKGAAFRGWLDERHLLVTIRSGDDFRVVIADETGRTVRTLATGPASVVDKVRFWYTRK